MHIDIATTSDLDQLIESTARLAELIERLSLPTFPLMLSTKQAIEYSGLPEGTLRKLRDVGRLVFHEIEGTKRYSRDDLNELVREVRATAGVAPSEL